MKNFFEGVNCLRLGCQDIFKRELRHYITIPLLINFLVFGGLFYCGIYYGFEKLSFLKPTSLPQWLSWLQSTINVIKYFILTFVLILSLSVFAFISNLVANLFASPFNGLLSDKYSIILGHDIPAKKPTLKMMRETIVRELKKLIYLVPRLALVGLSCLILHFMPPFNLLIPFIFFWFSAYSMAIQYIDYPADNHHVSFDDLLLLMKKNKRIYLGYGLSVALLSSIPFINFFVMPISVLGATRLWHIITMPQSIEK